MGAEWTGKVRIDGAGEAASSVDNLSHGVDRLSATTREAGAAMGGFNRTQHLVASIMSGNVSAAISGATTSLRGLWAAFKAAPFLTAIGAIAGAVAALVSIIEDRLIKATERYQKMAAGFKSGRDLFNEAMGNTPTARASRRAEALVANPTDDSLRMIDEGKAGAESVLGDAVKRYRRAVWEKDAGAAEYAAQQVAEAKAVVDVWTDAWERIRDARGKSEKEAAEASAKAEKDRARDQEERAKEGKAAWEARKALEFSRMTPEQQLESLQKRGRAMLVGGLTDKEAPEFYGLAQQADAIRKEIAGLRQDAKEKAAQEKAEAEKEAASRAERVAALRERLLSGPLSQVVSSGDWGAVYDLDRGQNVDLQARIEQNTREMVEVQKEIQKALHPVK